MTDCSISLSPELAQNLKYLRTVGRTVLMFDAANFRHACKINGIHRPSFAPLLGAFRQEADVKDSYYFNAAYAINDPTSGYSVFTNMLRSLDVIVVEKPSKVHVDDRTGEVRFKTNVDVELAVKAISISDHVDHYVLFTGDGDFVSLMQYLQSLGKTVTIVSALETLTSAELVDGADHFVSIESLKPLLQADVKPLTYTIDRVHRNTTPGALRKPKFVSSAYGKRNYPHTERHYSAQ